MIKSLIVTFLGKWLDYYWTKAENLRALVRKREIIHGTDFYLINPKFIQIYSNFTVGNNVYINAQITVMAHAPILIGDDVIIAPNVSLISVGHDPDLSGTACRESRVLRQIEIQSGVWIGSGSILLPGVTIGENSVIGAGSVVTKDVPKNSIAAGNPCRVIRMKKTPS